MHPTSTTRFHRFPPPNLPCCRFQISAIVPRKSPSFHTRCCPSFQQHASLSVPASADAIAASILKVSPNSPVEFVHSVDKAGGAGEEGKNRGEEMVVLPSPEFNQLCIEQMELFRMVFDPNAVLSVYVRPAGSYMMDQLELQRVVLYPGVDADETETNQSVIIIVNFGIPASLRAIEASLSSKQIDVLPDHGAIVLPMVKHPFIVGFLVAEIPIKESMMTRGEDQNDEPDLTPTLSLPKSDRTMWEIQPYKKELEACHHLTTEKMSRAVMIARSLAMAYVMDQRAILLQQSSWQNNNRMNHLIEQIRAPLSNMRTLSKMLTVHVKRNEISYDIIEDILVQGDQMKDTLEQLQDAVQFTKANIIRYNEESLKKLVDSSYGHPEHLRSLLVADHHHSRENTKKEKMDSVNLFANDVMEMPIPPLSLAPLQQNIRPCNVSEILEDLVGAATPLANKQKRVMEFHQYSLPQVAVDESALRQALSNLIEGSLLRTSIGGKVQIVATKAPSGGALIVIDDDGPDIHYMTQMRSLTPFGSDLNSDDMIEDNMAWNFIAGLTVSREILESYGCIIRVRSPYIADTALGSGGTRIELWLPLSSHSNTKSFNKA